MIPDYQTLMRPFLECASEGETHISEIYDQLADTFHLTEEERETLLPSGKMRLFENRVRWARTYLKQAGLVEATRRGYVTITEDGRRALQSGSAINKDYLKQFPAFQDFLSRSRGENDQPNDVVENRSSGTEISPISATPDEVLLKAFEQINNSLAADLLERVRNSTPQFFEELIVELLLAMGYGGAEDIGRALGRSGDNGVDGVIDQDPLGVDQIYIQAKRYQEGNNISGGDIRDFFGALNLKRAHKGIFFSTSNFTAQAKDTARQLGSRIVLIDGHQLAKLMLRYNVGCRDEQVLHIKKIDDEYFV